jgi:AbrB family looped-hinge helix DNA binding protein
MKTATLPKPVWFTTKGQIVIPLRLRKKYHIEAGTKAVIEETPEGILIKPVTRHSIARLRGILKRKPGDPPLTEQWAEHKREERELEERKHARRPGA